MGRVIVAGAGRMTVPSAGILASDLAVGSTVKLMEGSTAVDYLVVNQGIPSNSDLYDSSCNGTWLLRKDLVAKNNFNANKAGNIYADSTVDLYLNNDFFNSLGDVEKTTIKQVKIPYVSSAGPSASQQTVSIGDNGHSCKVFLLGGNEIGLDMEGSVDDGARLSYFIKATAATLIAYYNGTATNWWTRTTDITTTGLIYVVQESGGSMTKSYYGYGYGYRPALIIPSTAKFDPTTLILKG